MRDKERQIHKQIAFQFIEETYQEEILNKKKISDNKDKVKIGLFAWQK